MSSCFLHIETGLETFELDSRVLPPAFESLLRSMQVSPILCRMKKLEASFSGIKRKFGAGSARRILKIRGWRGET